MNRVELISISKTFGGITALEEVTLKVRQGEIHALVGENGAGKSTLMKILSGAYTKDKGKVFIDAEEVQINNTYDSKKLGIGIIYQEFSLVPALSVAENIFLSQLGSEGFWMNWGTFKRKASAIIQSIGFNIDPGLPIHQLSIAHQQIVEIAKALSEKVKVLILDEPSAVLGPHEVVKLFETLQRLKSEGVSIIYISHHLSEVFRIADRVTVLKDGKSSDSLITSETNQEAIIQLMLGRSLDTMFPKRSCNTGEEILRVESLEVENKIEQISFNVHAGEVLGIAGLVGSGRTEMMSAVYGAIKITGGRLFLEGHPAIIKTPAEAVKRGIGMVPEDRKKQGVILSLPIEANISLANLNYITSILGFLKLKKGKEIARTMIRKLLIKTKDENMLVSGLSGGNQQKVSLAKWISRNSKVMIIDEPTRGVDIGAKVEIYKLINELASAGKAIIVVSSETVELMGICDRLLVMRMGKIHGELLKNEFSEENILRLSIGA